MVIVLVNHLCFIDEVYPSTAVALKIQNNKNFRRSFKDFRGISFYSEAILEFNGNSIHTKLEPQKTFVNQNRSFNFSVFKCTQN